MKKFVALNVFYIVVILSLTLKGKEKEVDNSYEEGYHAALDQFYNDPEMINSILKDRELCKQ